MDQTIIEKIRKIREELGDKVIIAAHHYQMPDIVALADILGDSYKLAVDCSNLQADYIVFCGVSFMAQGASLLARKGQKVLLPDTNAGCPLAEMITASEAEKAWEIISKLTDKEIVPVGYVNSNVDIKDFCGAKGGAVCTSSNAAKIISYFIDQGKAVFFLPDYNLGRNTANALSIPDNEILKIKKDLSLEKQKFSADIKMFIWDGNCYVHKKFSAEAINKVRKLHPDIKVIVHPESNYDVINKSDAAGSTQFIYNEIKQSSPGSKWAIGTEIHFTERVATEFKNKLIIPLQKSPCTDMAKITPERLLASLKSIQDFENKQGDLKYEVIVENIYRENATKALKRMIGITNG